MIFAILGIIIVLSGVVLNHPDWMAPGIALIIFDIALEMASLNTNLRVMIHNFKMLYEMIKAWKK